MNNNKEQELLKQIIKHFKAYSEDQIKIIQRCLNGENGVTNVYQAKQAADELVVGLELAGDYLIHPNRFAYHIIENCCWCKVKKDEAK